MLPGVTRGAGWIQRLGKGGSCVVQIKFGDLSRRSVHSSLCVVCSGARLQASHRFLRVLFTATVRMLPRRTCLPFSAPAIAERSWWGAAGRIEQLPARDGGVPERMWRVAGTTGGGAGTVWARGWDDGWGSWYRCCGRGGRF